jgi:hypothetical protein
VAAGLVVFNMVGLLERADMLLTAPVTAAMHLRAAAAQLSTLREAVQTVQVERMEIHEGLDSTDLAGLLLPIEDAEAMEETA